MRAMKSAALATALAIGAALSAGSAGAVSVVNGSFETTGAIVPPASSFSTLNAVIPAEASGIPGWTVSTGSIDWINGYWQAADGTHSLDLNGLSAGAVSQEITGLIVGHQYQIDFSLAGNPDGGPVTKLVGVTASISSQGYTFDTTGHDKNNMGWVTETFTFTAGHTSELLSFESAVFFGGAAPYAAAYGPAIDNVSILDSGWRNRANATARSASAVRRRPRHDWVTDAAPEA